MHLEDLKNNAVVRGILPGSLVTVVNVTLKISAEVRAGVAEQTYILRAESPVSKTRVSRTLWLFATGEFYNRALILFINNRWIARFTGIAFLISFAVDN